jgi:uncharacterized protein (DUF2252 family)
MMPGVVDHIRGQKPAQRKQFIIDVFHEGFGELIRADPSAFRGKFRKMAATPFAFYRGSAVLFYADMAHDNDPFLDDKTSRVWIQGDLHAENFGTYMNSAGVLVFDVNDFDEAYVGPFTWDLKRLAASLALLGYQKALSDEEIRQMIEAVTRSYIEQVARFASGQQTGEFALTLTNTQGALLNVIRAARVNSRWQLLEANTTINDFDRRFALNDNTRAVDATTRQKVMEAFELYLQTIPSGKRFAQVNYNVKDIVARRGVGIGSAGLPSYNLLVEGPTQALENDILIYMKQAQVAAPSRVVTDPKISSYFEHNGHRTVLSQRALQAYADPWLGYTAIDGVGQLVAEISPYTADLEWDDINDVDDIVQVLGYLGQAVAKIHCVSDVDSDQTLVPFSTDQAIHAALQGKEDAFVAAMIEFGQSYGDLVRDDYRMFIDAFRNHEIAGV